MSCFTVFTFFFIALLLDAFPSLAFDVPNPAGKYGSGTQINAVEYVADRQPMPWQILLLLDDMDTPQSERITFTGGGELGIFDPSIASDPETIRLWMSYSAVDESQFYDPSLYWGVSIRLAYSDDKGSTWQDAGVVVSAFSEHTVGPLTVTHPLPPIDTGSAGIWQSETSTLIYDSGAPAAERWKILWFQYLHADGISYFLDYSWLAMKAAATPLDLAAAEPVKLFGGFGLQSDGETTTAPAFSPIGGPPAIYLNSDLTQAAGNGNLADLSTCVFAEPGLHATNTAVYLSVFCAEVGPTTSEYVEHFRCASPCAIDNAGSWVYLGRILTPADAAAAAGRDHYQAPAIVEQSGKSYLIVTPVDVTSGNRYDGCRVYEFSDIDTGILARDNGSELIEVQRVSGQAGTHHGACAAFDGLRGGIIYSQFEPTNPPKTFRIYKSKLSLP